MAESGVIVSIDKVKKELYDKNDELEKWCKENLPANFFKDSSEVITEYSRISVWVASMSHHYLPGAISEFLDGDEADAFIIAYALFDLQNRIIVTQEVSQPGRKNKIKIPEPFNIFGIRYISTIEMFRMLGETF